MQNNINKKMYELQKRALQRKLSCPSVKSAEDISIEKSYFEHMKQDLYVRIGGKEKWS